MKKSVSKLTIAFTLAAFVTVHLFCVGFDSPSSPEKTNASLVFMSSTSKIYEGAIVDSVGKEIQIGAALYLPANFDSVLIQVLDEGKTVIDTVFRAFKSEYYFDTLWVRHTFLKPGMKNVTVTPFSNPERAALSTTITIQGIEQIPRDTTPPALLFVTPSDTNATISTETFTVDLVASDSNGVASVLASMGSKAFQSTLKSDHYTIQVTGFTRGEINVVTVNATDSAIPGNTVSRKLYFNYHPSKDTVKYKVIYNGNGNTGGTVPADSNRYTMSSTVIVKDNTGSLTKTGARFKGWNTVADGSGIAYPCGVNVVMGSADIVLYAQWTICTTFTVTYKGNGNSAGATPADTNKYEVAALITVKDNTGALVKPSATFTGWNTIADGSGIAYAGGVTFVIGSVDVVLYAQWTTGATFSVTYKGNGNSAGILPVDANKYVTSATVTVRDNVGSLTKTGETFKGWNTAIDGSGTAYAGGVTFAMGNTDVILYAQWTTNPTFKVTYDGNGNTAGTVPVDANKYETASSITVKGNTGSLVKTGCTFTGWNTAANGSGLLYAEGAKFSITTTDLVLYAQWAVSKYTVTFNSMEGSAVASQTIDHGGKVTEPVAPIRTGYTFVGWYKEAAYTTQWNFSMETVSANDTLFAKWAAVTYTVTFDDQQATTHVSPVSKTIVFPSTTIGTLPSEPKKTGYTFCCWNTAANGSGSEFTALTTVTADITIYAVWNSHTFTVTYEGQGVVTNSTKEVTSPKTTVETVPAPTVSGYLFEGWFTGINGGGSPFLGTTTVASDITVYAKWTRVYKVTYNANGGTGTVPVDPNTYQNSNTVTVLSGSGLSKANYTFAGWNTQTDTMGTSYTSGGPLTMGSVDITLYAKWRLNAPTISTITNKTCPVNDSVTFSVTATGLNLGYTWYMNNAEIGNANGASYTTSKLTAAEVSTPRTYKCVVTNPAGSANSSASLAVSTISDIDGNVYHEVKIGSQVWTMENLRVTKYRDGTAIPKETNGENWSNAETPMYCFYNNATNADTIIKWGALYNWYVVDKLNPKKVAPSGWHVPTDEEWTTLENYLIANGYNWDRTTSENKIGKSLASATTDWMTSSTEGDVGKNIANNNGAGFSALPSGYCAYNGTFYHQYGIIYWWSTTESDSTNAFCRSLGSSNSNLFRDYNNKKFGFAFRLVRD